MANTPNRLPDAFSRLTGRSTAWLAALRHAAQAAPTGWPVLLRGETGTGKTLLAEAIHAASGCSGSFVTLNCAALAPALIESELFGHVRGAFTGASRTHAGLFRKASGGTLFLDEIGDLSPEAQAKLLRVVESGSVRPIGGETETAVDVRLIGATHRPLEERVKSGTFREDLLFRLNTVAIELPPLRERGDDVPLLAARFLGEVSPGATLQTDALAALRRHSWPGNLRELATVIRRAAVAVGEGRPVARADLPPLAAPGRDGVDAEPVTLLRKALIAPDAETDAAWGAFLLAYAAAEGKDTLARPRVLELMRRLRGNKPTEAQLRLEWNRKIRQRVIDTGLVRATRRQLHIDLDACRGAIAADKPVATPPATARPPAVAPSTTPAPSPRSNLPHTPPVLIGRDRTVAELSNRVKEQRLITLAGPGGVGKTSLSLAVACRLRDEYTGGVWFLDLREAEDADDIRHALAAVLGVPLDSTRADAQLADALVAAGPALLVADNFEQVVAHAPATVGAWLERAPELHILATSRSLLGLRGEVRIPLDPLPAPGPPPPDTPLAELEGYEAAHLFVARARHVIPDFALTPDNAAPIAAICAKLGGLPLAIEMAAARLRVLSPGELAGRLDDAFAVLRSQRRDLPDHQRSMRDTLAWSIDLLTPAEQTAFARLTVFRGGFTLESAEAVTDPSGEDNGLAMIDALEGLVDKSLLRRVGEGDIGTDAAVRFDFFPVVREYGLERQADLLPADATGALQQSHAEWFAGLAAWWWEQVRTGDGDAWRQALEDARPELPNLQAAVEHDRAQGRADRAARTTAAATLLLCELGEMALARRWIDRYGGACDTTDPLTASVLDYVWSWTHASFSPGDPQVAGRIERAIDRLEGIDTTTDPACADRRDYWLVVCRTALANRLFLINRDPDGAEKQLGQAVDLARKLGDETLLARALFMIGQKRWYTDRDPGARELFRESAELARTAGRPRVVFRALHRLALSEPDLGRARAALAEARTLLDIAPDPMMEYGWYGTATNIEIARGDPVRACRYGAQQVAVTRRLGGGFQAVMALLMLAQAELVTGDYEAAIAHAREAQAEGERVQSTSMSHGRGAMLLAMGLAMQGRPTLALEVLARCEPADLADRADGGTGMVARARALADLREPADPDLSDALATAQERVDELATDPEPDQTNFRKWCRRLLRETAEAVG